MTCEGRPDLLIPTAVVTADVKDKGRVRIAHACRARHAFDRGRFSTQFELPVETRHDLHAVRVAWVYDMNITSVRARFVMTSNAPSSPRGA